MIRKAAFASASLNLGLATILAAFGSPLSGVAQHESHNQAPPKLVQTVREATARYTDVNNATAEGYGPLFGCVSGSDHGAMGVHYVNPTLLGPTTMDATQPQALIYEPVNGEMKLVGVEFIADAKTWLSKNSAPPVLEGQVFLFVDSPNRFNIPAFFELHVWAWRDNPQGSFVDWNNHVSCNGQK
ncbi:MAG TPA: hypothetical protein VGF82_07870 [Terracidiphilus sp.]|jgi:hypothetical protein